jgi:beta-glucanase (GH16 family)
MRFARLLVVAAMAFGALLPGIGVRAHEGVLESQAASPPPEIARTTVFLFRGERLDPRRWKVVEHSGAGKNTPFPEMQYYSPDAVSVDGGVLHISALALRKLDPSDGWDYRYRSGRVESRDAYLYGRFNVRIKVPIGNGLWPAVWMRTPESAGPMNGQLGIFDGFGSHTDAFTASMDTFQKGRLVARNCVIVENYDAQTQCTRIGNPLHKRINFAKEYHTFGIDWQPDHITWSVDSKPYWTVTKGVPNVPMVLVMDLAVGGIQDGPPPLHTRFPADFEIAAVAITR